MYLVQQAWSAGFDRLRSNCPPELRNDMVLDEDHFTTGDMHPSDHESVMACEPQGREQYIVNWWPASNTKASVRALVVVVEDSHAAGGG